MELSYDGHEVCVRLPDDVWQLSEPGTLCLTRKQALLLRLHLNQIGVRIDADLLDEDG
jgi:hypothetical protein